VDELRGGIVMGEIKPELGLKERDWRGILAVAFLVLFGAFVICLMFLNIPAEDKGEILKYVVAGFQSGLMVILGFYFKRKV